MVLNGGEMLVMRLLLVPWSSFSGPRLRIYRLPIRDHANPDIEISTFKGQRIALKLLDEHAVKKKLTTYNPYRSLRMAVEVQLSEDDADGIFRTLSALSRVKPSVLRKKVFDELAEDPNLEKLERILALSKLIN